MEFHSMNDEIYFKMTHVGDKVMRDNATRFHTENPNVDIQYSWKPWRGKWYREQLHEVFKELGGQSYVGCLLPITDITFEEPPEEVK